MCAPYFKKIAQEVLLYLRIPPDTDFTVPEWKPAVAEEDLQDFIPDAMPIETLAALDAQPPVVEENTNVVTVPIEDEWILMPDFRGLSKRSVLNRCIDLGIRLISKGSGMAIYQSPSPGTKVPVGSKCNVTFTTTKLKEPLAALDALPAARQVNMEPSPGNSF